MKSSPNEAVDAKLAQIWARLRENHLVVSTCSAENNEFANRGESLFELKVIKI